VILDGAVRTDVRTPCHTRPMGADAAPRPRRGTVRSTSSECPRRSGLGPCSTRLPRNWAAPAVVSGCSREPKSRIHGKLARTRVQRAAETPLYCLTAGSSRPGPATNRGPVTLRIVPDCSRPARSHTSGNYVISNRRRVREILCPAKDLSGTMGPLTGIAQAYLFCVLYLDPAEGPPIGQFPEGLSCVAKASRSLSCWS
jgi:hypothetical protein